MASPKARRKKTHALEAVVEEALGTVLSPTRVVVVLREAVELAGLDLVPTEPMALRVFVEGALFTALSEHLEISDVLEILNQLRKALDHAYNPGSRPAEATSDVRGSHELGDHPRRVLVATKASLVVFLLQDMLGDDVEILPVSTEGQLADRLRRASGPLLLIIDRKHPCVGPEIARHLEQLQPGSSVIWWGGPAHEQLQIEGALAGGARFIATDEALRLADLGELCAEHIAVD